MNKFTQNSKFHSSTRSKVIGLLHNCKTTSKKFPFVCKQKTPSICDFLTTKNDINLKLSDNFKLNEQNQFTKFNIYIFCRFEDISNLYFFCLQTETFWAHFFATAFWPKWIWMTLEFFIHWFIEVLHCSQTDYKISKKLGLS